MTCRPRRIGVRAFVETVARSGDLRRSLGTQTSPEEGIAAQQALVAREAPGYEAEVALARTFTAAGVQFTLRGRADGLRRTPSRWIVDEIKTSRTDPLRLHQEDGALHWAQLECYAALLALTAPQMDRWELRLRYLSPEHETEYQQTRGWSRAELLQALLTRLQTFGALWARELKRRAQRNERLAALAFPLPAFRPNQRALAARVWQAACNGDSLLLEASTGLGKTLGVLYPTLRAIAAAPFEQVLYLTARTSGGIAAERAARQLESRSPPIRWLRLQSRAQGCGAAVPKCVEGDCPRARGYYDRLPAALAAVPEFAALDAQAIRALADRFALCPFELSLDLAPWVDLIIGDYNYVFDPEVRLKRLADGRERFLLIDEAHQLSPRAIDSLSATLDLAALGEQCARLPDSALRRALAQIRAVPVPSGSGPLPAQTLEQLERRIDVLFQTLAPMNWQEELDEAQRQLLWDLAHWRRRSELRETLPYVALQAEDAACLQLRCLDAGTYLAEQLGRYHGNVRFSGTLTPHELTAQLHGQHDAPAAHIGSPFAATQLAVTIVTDVPTYLRQRERSLPALVALLHQLLQAQGGTYLVALPSFAYLEMLTQALHAHSLEARIIAQTRQMSSGDQSAFLAQLASAGAAGASVLGCVVLGGVFAESVDYSGITLAGVVCVGVGLAPPSAELRAREAHLRDHHDADRARTLTATLPAMTKIVQMAGRLLRSPEDRGVLCLVDDRFAEPDYRQFFPTHWVPKVLRAAQLTQELERFWSSG